MSKLNFLLATSNAHKKKEFEILFSPDVVILETAPKKLAVDENGSSFFQNALLKAEAYYKEFNRPVLSDDSGINVESLPGELGVQSARFGGEGLSDKERALYF